MEINHRFINFILIILITYILIKNISNEKKLKSIEKFVNVQDVDIDAIRNLSEIAKELQKGGLTVAGDLTVTGKIKTENLEIGDGTKFTKNNNNTISGATTFSNNLQINGKTNANSIEASNITATNNVTVNNNVTVANKIKSKHLDITNGSTDEKAWTKFNNNGKNYIAGHNWIEAKGNLNKGDNVVVDFNDFMKYKGFKPGYIGFGKITDGGTFRDVPSVIIYGPYRNSGYAGTFKLFNLLNNKYTVSSIDFKKNPIIQTLDSKEGRTNNFIANYDSTNNFYRSYTNPIDNTNIQDNIIYNLQPI